MKTSLQSTTLAALLALALAPAPLAFAADSAQQAALVKEKIQSLRQESAQTRNQIALTLEELSRLNVKDIELRPQFEKYKAELAKMEGRAKIARDRAVTMKEKGQSFFSEWEQQAKKRHHPSAPAVPVTHCYPPKRSTAQSRKGYTRAPRERA